MSWWADIGLMQSVVPRGGETVERVRGPHTRDFVRDMEPAPRGRRQQDQGGTAVRSLLLMTSGLGHCDRPLEVEGVS